MVTTTDQITALEGLLARVEAGEVTANLSDEILAAFGFTDCWFARDIVRIHEAADAFERAVYPFEPGEWWCIDPARDGTIRYERRGHRPCAPSLPAAKVAWVIKARIAELKAMEKV